MRNCFQLSRLINKLGKKFDNQEADPEAQNETAKTLALLAREWRGQAAELRNVVEGRAAAKLAMSAPVIEVPSPYLLGSDESAIDSHTDSGGDIGGGIALPILNKHGETKTSENSENLL